MDRYVDKIEKAYFVRMEIVAWSQPLIVSVLIRRGMVRGGKNVAIRLKY